MKLNTEQIQEFHTRGVLIAKNALTDEDLQPVIDEISAFIDCRALELRTEGNLENLRHSRGKAVFEFMRNPNLLDDIESLIGPENTCNPIQHLRPTPPIRYYEDSNPAAHIGPLHQDAGVIMPEAEGSDIITCWLPLGDASSEMGCLEVLPGVVGCGYLRHRSEGGTTIFPDEVPEIEPTSMACCKGDLMLMSRFTPHRGMPNRSDKCRWSMDLRYHPTGQHTGRTEHPDFVVRSQTNPDRALTDQLEWCRLWIDAFENPRGVVMYRADCWRKAIGIDGATRFADR